MIANTSENNNMNSIGSTVNIEGTTLRSAQHISNIIKRPLLLRDEYCIPDPQSRIPRRLTVEDIFPILEEDTVRSPTITTELTRIIIPTNHDGVFLPSKKKKNPP